MDFSFEWHLREDDWTDYCSRAENYMLGIGDCLGSIYVGDICFDVTVGQPDDNTETVLSLDMYVGGIDSGYGYSAFDALRSGKYKDKYSVPDNELYPYTRVDEISGTFPDGCVWMTFDEFKNAAETKMKEMLEEATNICNFDILAKANKPVHVW